jgi:hypothetical protein
MARKNLFTVVSPLGYRVALSRNRWREITRYKHPALFGREELVHRCLREPELICASIKDPDVQLYYLTWEQGYVCVVVGGDDPHKRFVVTAYFTKNIKKGQALWTK